MFDNWKRRPPAPAKKVVAPARKVVAPAKKVVAPAKKVTNGKTSSGRKS